MNGLLSVENNDDNDNKNGDFFKYSYSFPENSGASHTPRPLTPEERAKLRKKAEEIASICGNNDKEENSNADLIEAKRRLLAEKAREISGMFEGEKYK